MWWRPRQSEIPIDRIAPLYPAFPFVEEEPLPQGGKQQPHSGKPQSPAPKAASTLPDATLPDSVRRSLLNEAARQKYATYTSFRIKSYVRPPVGIQLDRKA